MIVVLLPLLGRFTDNFSSEDIAFTDGLSGAKVRTGRKMEDGCYELIIEAPKEAMEEEDGYSCFGGIALREGSMFSPDGTTYGKVLTASRKFSMDTVGRDLTNNDINSIKKIVGGFGNTTAGTVMGVLSGAGTAYTIGSSILGLVGVLPTDSSRHKELMKKLQEIQNKLNKVSEQCDYMVGALDHHTKMLIDMTRDSNEKYVGDFDSKLSNMAGIMDSLEQDIQKPVVQEDIEEVLLRLCEKYEIPQTGIGRDIDDELMIVPDEEYLGYVFEEDDASYVEEETMDFDELIASDGLLIVPDEEHLVEVRIGLLDVGSGDHIVEADRSHERIFSESQHVMDLDVLVFNRIMGGEPLVVEGRDRIVEDGSGQQVLLEFVQSSVFGDELAVSHRRIRDFLCEIAVLRRLGLRADQIAVGGIIPHHDVFRIFRFDGRNADNVADIVSCHGRELFIELIAVIWSGDRIRIMLEVGRDRN
jgi:hypothetical protein